MKRLISCDTSDLLKMSKKQKLESILASEGRVSMSESVVVMQSQLPPLSNAELACAFGADMLLLNVFNVNRPMIAGIGEGDDVVKKLKNYTGRLVGCNLEPQDKTEDMIGEKFHLDDGRTASLQNAKRALELGFDFILLTGNPGTGVSNKRILEVLKEISDELGDEIILMAGKMHAAGSRKEAGNKIVDEAMIREFSNAGADVILLPCPGTVPGIQVDFITKMVDEIHSLGKLALTAIGTSQESSDKNTIQQLALMAKMTGTDIHHIGDAGVGGIDAENILHYNIAIKGKRHTYTRIARSVNR